MYPTDLKREQRFQQRFPLSFVAVLAIIQMLTTFVIVVTEIGHNLLHMKLTNLFAGFWISIPFTILWISMFAIVCCCRRHSCATHAVLQNVFALIFASLLIVVNSLFIRSPNQCFFPYGICQKLTWISHLSDSIECLVDGLSNDCGTTRISLIIAQLIAAVCLAISSIVYLIIYTVYIRRSSRVQNKMILPSNELVIPSIYSSNKQQVPMTVSHHLHSYTFSAHPYGPSAPLMMPIYSPVPAIQPAEGHYVNYIGPNPYATIRTQMNNERF